MRVALVGVTLSGKSTLFAAVSGTGQEAPGISHREEAHRAVVKVPDERLQWLAERYQPKKTTLAELEFLDLPGLDLSSPAGRNHAKTHWAAMRQSDMLLFVVRAFEDPAVPAYRGRTDAQGDLEELLAEMIFADLDQATARIGKLQASLRKPSPDHAEQQKELELMQRLAKALENDHPVAEVVSTDGEAKLLRSFAFLSQKPSLAILNCAEGALTGPAPQELASLPCLRLSAKIEAEIARLNPDERAEFLADLGIATAARERVIRACYERMNLVSFFTTVSDECRAWTIPASTEAVVAAGRIHSDMARGFIRAETVSFEDLCAAGDMKAAKAAGKVRLEGKTYLVQDGDVINFRFNV